MRIRTRVFFFRDINDFDEYPDCVGTVGEQIDAVMHTIAVANPTRITFPGNPGAEGLAERTQRHETTQYPELALREAITNALIHRDYTLVGADVEVKIFRDRLVIMNPGSLLGGLTTEDLKTDPPRSHRRNPKIAEVASFDHWVERAGTGTTRMIKLCEDKGLPVPEFEDRPSGFTVVFREDHLDPAKLAEVGLDDRQITAVMHVKAYGRISNKEYRAVVGTSERSAARDLSDLVSRGILIGVGSGRSKHYVSELRSRWIG